MADPADIPQLETVADRLQKLEQTLAKLQPAHGTFPDGFAAGPPAGGGSLVPGAVLRAVLPAAVDPHGLWARIPILAELRLMVRMYIDPHYRLSRVGQFGIPAVVGLMVLNYLLFNFWSLPLLSLMFPIIERVVLVVLAVVLYKILAREAARYAAVLDYLTRYGR